MRVAMFSTVALKSVTVAPAGEGAWSATCSRCAHQPLQSSLRFNGPGELFAGGPIRLRDEVSGQERVATGRWHLKAAKDGVDIVLTLPSERYVAAVLNAEVASSEFAASLEAMAITVRTYALNGSHYSAPSGHLAAELCDSTQCQAMRPGTSSAAVSDAVKRTAGETIWFAGRRAEVYFSENCGGTTEDALAVWPAPREVPYLHSHADPYCVRSSAAKWHAEVTVGVFLQIAAVQGWHIPPDFTTAEVVECSASHRALKIRFADAQGRQAVVGASTLRFAIDRALGWNQVRSDGYDLAVRHGALIFDGRGFGHGIGLCQAGAAEMGKEGKSARDILAFYFPGTSASVGGADHGWTEVKDGPITVRSVSGLSEPEHGQITQTWKDAQSRFKPRTNLMPVVTFAPSTEIFRQLTAEPGWMLAATAVGSIVLQPMSVLRAYTGGWPSTLLHEMLHVLVESEATARAPLWLREGLVEVLAGEHGVASPVTAAVLGEWLSHPATQQQSDIAHKAAAFRVQHTISRYGASAVRGWLTTGVPSGVP